eukprot:gene2047-3033_t
MPQSRARVPETTDSNMPPAEQQEAPLGVKVRQQCTSPGSSCCRPTFCVNHNNLQTNDQPWDPLDVEQFAAEFKQKRADDPTIPPAHATEDKYGNQGNGGAKMTIDQLIYKRHMDKAKNAWGFDLPQQYGGFDNMEAFAEQ